MENKENKIKAVKLSDDELENVSGAVYAIDSSCGVCGASDTEPYSILGITVHYCETCRKKKLGW